MGNAAVCHIEAQGLRSLGPGVVVNAAACHRRQGLRSPGPGVVVNAAVCHIGTQGLRSPGPGVVVMLPSVI